MSSGWHSQIFENKILLPEFEPMGLNQAQNEIFSYFLSLNR